MLSAIHISPLLTTLIPVRKADTIIKGGKPTASALIKIKKSQNLDNNYFMIRIHHVLSWKYHPSHLRHSVFLPGSSQPSRRKMSCKHDLRGLHTYDTSMARLGNIKLTTKRTKQQGCQSKALLSPDNIDCSVDKISPCSCAWTPLRDINFCCLVNNCLLSPEGTGGFFSPLFIYLVVLRSTSSDPNALKKN